MVLVFETVIYPCFKTVIPSMQKRIGLGMFVGLVGLLVLLVLDVYGYNRLLNEGSVVTNFTSNVSHVQLNCYLVNESKEESLDISVHAVSAVMLLGAVAETLLFIAGTHKAQLCYKPLSKYINYFFSPSTGIYRSSESLWHERDADRRLLLCAWTVWILHSFPPPVLRTGIQIPPPGPAHRLYHQLWNATNCHSDCDIRCRPGALHHGLKEVPT